MVVGPHDEVLLAPEHTEYIGYNSHCHHPKDDCDYHCRDGNSKIDVHGSFVSDVTCW